jgi:hypothetical protein
VYKYVYERIAEFYNSEIIDKKLNSETTSKKCDDEGITKRKKQLINAQVDASHYTLKKTDSLLRDGIPSHNNLTCRLAIVSVIIREDDINKLPVAMNFQKNSSEAKGFMEELSIIFLKMVR